MRPDAARHLEDVEKKLLDWKDLRYLEEVDEGLFDGEQKATIFNGMLPDVMAQHLFTRSRTAASTTIVVGRSCSISCVD